MPKIKEEVREYKTKSGALRWLEKNNFKHLQKEFGCQYENTHELKLSNTEVWTAELIFMCSGWRSVSYVSNYYIKIYWSGE